MLRSFGTVRIRSERSSVKSGSRFFTACLKASEIDRAVPAKETKPRLSEPLIIRLAKLISRNGQECACEQE